MDKEKLKQELASLENQRIAILSNLNACEGAIIFAKKLIEDEEAGGVSAVMDTAQPEN